MSVAAGDVIAGKYRVLGVIGRGGMGVVVSAEQRELDRRVAIKLLHPELARNPEIVARFAREARAAAKIQSEHVARVLDVGTLENGAPFIVMEHLEGSDLAEVVKRRGALPGQEVVEHVLQACEALAEAHVAGIVHRDLKPANLFLTTLADGSPSIKILDFGISKVAAAEGQGMTQTSSMMGSPSYMAPEQLRSARDVDARTDIWALGIILHELLTGEVAFQADTVPELYVAILQKPPTPLRARRPDAPPAMEALILRCLEKDPARRFASVADLAAALGPLSSARARPSVDRIARVLGAHAPTAFALTAMPDAAPAAGPAPGSSSPPQPTPGSSPPTRPTPPSFHPSAAATIPAAPVGAAGSGFHPIAPPGGHPLAAPGPAPSPNRGHGPASPHAAHALHAAHAHPPAPPPPHLLLAQRGYGPPGPPVGARPRPPWHGLSPALIGLIVLVVLVVFSGGCMLCFFAGAAGNAGGMRRSRGALDRRHGGGRPVAGRVPFHPGVPFQRPAGWTTVALGAATRHLLPRRNPSPGGDTPGRIRRSRS